MGKKKYDAELAREQDRMGCSECLLRIGTPGFEMGCKSEKGYRAYCGMQCLNKRVPITYGMNILPAR
jgi:hypothetical protein